MVDSSNDYHELKVPSGVQTGVKIVQGFDLSAGGTTELILDFDASKSVVVSGNSGNYLLQPTIKVLNIVEASIITGTVTRASDASVIEGAMVSAQTYSASATDVKDQVTVETATLSSDLGIYSEHHPQFMGLFEGDRSRDTIRNRVASADCILQLGAAMTDLNTGGFTTHLDDSKTISANIRSVKIKHHHYKNLVFHGPNKLMLEDRPKPKIIEATDAIVRITTTSICGTDLHILKGDVPTIIDGRILGHEGVGIVDDVAQDGSVRAHRRQKTREPSIQFFRNYEGVRHLRERSKTACGEGGD